MPSEYYTMGNVCGTINFELGSRNSGDINGALTLIMAAPNGSRRPGTEYEHKFTFMIDSP